MTSAIVLGFNIHGLAIARALTANGIEVHAISATLDIPSAATRFAIVHHRPEVNSDAIVTILEEFSEDILQGHPAVLFPTNDNMVGAIGRQWSRLEGKYLLSWGRCAKQILHLLEKKNLPAICAAKKIDHPTSVIIDRPEDSKLVLGRISLPALLKPSKPMSGFKTLVVTSNEALCRVVREHANDLPIIAQPYLDGPDNALFFCSMYFQHGRCLAEFTGRKLASNPPSLGQGTVLAGEECKKVLELAAKFCEDLELSGPVAIEFKQDPAGRFWLIEPNIGRTEYCVDLLIQSGVNLPLIEYQDATGADPYGPLKPTINRAWYDTEKDPRCYLRFVVQSGSLTPFGKMPIFPYFWHSDYRPLLRAGIQVLRRIFRIR